MIPYLFYEDVAGASAWLREAFDFTETLRHTTRDGIVTHVELTCGGESIMLGAVDRGEGQALGYRTPRGGSAHSSFVFIIIPDDVEAHFERAVRAGATVIAPPEDKPTASGSTPSRTPKAIAGRSASRCATCCPRNGARRGSAGCQLNGDQQASGGVT